jgi:hypothetical protein
MDLIVQTSASLVAILALAGLAWWLRLGGTPRLATVEAVARAAGEIEDGFVPVDAACDAAGAGALVRDEAGRIMVIKRHGNRFAGRVLGPGAAARLARTAGAGHLVVDPGEPRFGEVALDIPDAAAWAEAINRLGERQDA